MSIEKKSKRVFLAVLGWVVILGIVSAVVIFIFKPKLRERLKKETGSESQYQHRISLHLDSFSGYCILRSPEMQDILKTEGIKLDIEDDKADYIDRLKALESGNADMAVFTIDSLITAGIKIGDFPASVVMVIDETKGADAILAYKTSIQSFSNLNRGDARFVLTPSSPSEFLARVVVADFSLPNLSENWIIEADGAADVYKKLKKASKTSPTAYVLWEPYVSKALEDSDVSVLLGSDKLKGYIVDVLVARRKFLKENPDLVKSVVKAYLTAAYSYSQNGMLQLVMNDAEITGEKLSKKDAENVIKGVQWKNTLENYAHFGLLSRQESQGLDSLEDMITKITKVLVTTGAFNRADVKFQANNLFYDKVLEELKTSNFHPSRKLGLIDSPVVAQLEKVRGSVELPALSDQEWDDLMPVGQMRIDSLSFGRGTANLNIQSKRDLEDLATRLKSMPEYYLFVVGHSRVEGDAEANKLLAENRAKVAAEYLILRLGIGRDRIRVITEPSSDTGGEAQSVTFQLGQRPY